jgi:hypothetical protein
MVASSQVVRLSVIGLLGVATAGMFLVSMRGNYLFGYSLGQSPEKRQLFAWANVAADIWKGFGLIALTVLWRNHHKRMALIGGFAWLVCLVSGVNSAIGVYVHDRMAVTGSREAKHATYRDTARQLAELEEKLQRLPPHRGASQVEAAVAALLNAPLLIDERVRGTIGQRSANCTKVETRTAEACAKVGVLGEERAVAREGQALEARIDAVRRDLARMRDEGASDAPDPIGEFYAWATRGLLSVRDVGFGFPLFFAVLIEVVSAFGPITIARYAELTRPPAAKGDVLVTPAMASHDRPRPAAVLALKQRQGAVDEWMAARAAPAADACVVSLEALHADYQCWCGSNHLRALERTEFGRAFDELRDMPELTGKIRKFGSRYYGIKLGDEVGTLRAGVMT